MTTEAGEEKCVRNRVEQWQFWVLWFSGQVPLISSRAVETLWTEHWAGTVAKRGRRVYAATRSGPKTEIPDKKADWIGRY